MLPVRILPCLIALCHVCVPCTHSRCTCTACCCTPDVMRCTRLSSARLCTAAPTCCRLTLRVRPVVPLLCKQTSRLNTPSTPARVHESPQSSEGALYCMYVWRRPRARMHEQGTARARCSRLSLDLAPPIGRKAFILFRGKLTCFRASMCFSLRRCHLNLRHL